MDIWEMAETLVGYFGADGAAEEARQRAAESALAGTLSEANEWMCVSRIISHNFIDLYYQNTRAIH